MYQAHITLEGDRVLTEYLKNGRTVAVELSTANPGADDPISKEQDDEAFWEWVNEWPGD